MSAGMPLMQTLAQRKTTRAFADRPLPTQTLSNLLWAAFGVNRPRAAKPDLGRTAPSAYNKQEIELYVVLQEGVFVYDAEADLLRPVVPGDLRVRMGDPPAGKAAVTLVYAAGAKQDYAQVDVGFIGQNVYLFAASEGLNAWFYTFHGKQDATTVAELLKFPAGKHPLYAQSVGFPPR
jgi:nitroreductase